MLRNFDFIRARNQKKYTKKLFPPAEEIKIKNPVIYDREIESIKKNK